MLKGDVLENAARAWKIHAMKGNHIHPALARILQFLQDHCAAEWPAPCQHDNRCKKNDYHCQRSTRYELPRFPGRRGNDYLLHFSARELKVLEASN
jgi:hypothetical protein